MLQPWTIEEIERKEREKLERERPSLRPDMVEEEDYYSNQPEADSDHGQVVVIGISPEDSSIIKI